MKIQLFGIFVLALIMIALPLHLRFAHNNLTMAGTEPYYHARMAIELSEGKIPKTDTAIVGGRPYVINAYHVVLATGYKVLGPLAFNLFPPVFAFASFIFFWLLLKKLEVSENTQAWMLLSYALSPPLASISILGTPYAFVLALLTGGSYFLLTKWWIAGMFAVSIASLTGPIYAIAAIVFLLILILTSKEDTRNLTITFFISIFIGINMTAI